MLLNVFQFLILFLRGEGSTFKMLQHKSPPQGGGGEVCVGTAWALKMSAIFYNSDTYYFQK